MWTRDQQSAGRAGAFPGYAARKVLGAVLSAALVTTTAFAWPYAERRAAAVKTCEAIDPSAYQSGLLFNPNGYRSFYVRSQCFQQAAVKFRDVSLCQKVKRRLALFSSSWGYSGANCRTLVNEAAARDRSALQEIRRAYLAGHMVLRDFHVELDNNGRDFDIVPLIEGTAAHGYTLRFEIVDGAGAPVLLHANGYFMDRTPLRIYITRADVRQRVPGFSAGVSYQVAANMQLSVPATTMDAEWSEKFVEAVFPVRERSQRVTKRIVFPPQQVIRRPPGIGDRR